MPRIFSTSWAVTSGAESLIEGDLLGPGTAIFARFLSSERTPASRVYPKTIPSTVSADIVISAP